MKGNLASGSHEVRGSIPLSSTTRILRFIATLALSTVATVAAPWFAAGDPAPRTSFLLVTIDTLRADRVGCYGAAHARTPTLDALAAAGVRFDEARAHTPLTLPSHATLLTGLLPPRHGLRANGLFALDAGAPTLAAALRDAGWSTGAVVASVVLDRAHGLDRGFDVYDDNQRVGDRRAFDYRERGASQIVDAALATLERLEPPFVLWVHLYDPHLPWIAPESFAVPGGDGYDAEIAFADDAVGRILERARRRARGRLTTIATSDHGESLGEHGERQHGYTLHRGVLRVPLIVAGDGVPAGRVVGGDVGLVDVAPTIAALAGVSLGEVDGHSLVPRWRTAPGRSPRSILWEESLHPLYDSGWAPLRGLLTSAWHVVDAPRPELYDRRRDPNDREDLAAANPAILQRMLARLRARGRELGDVAEPAPTLADGVERRQLLERLESLGYLGDAGPGDGRVDRLDPKDGLPGFLALERADELLDAGRPAEAAAAIEPWARRDPSNPRLWHQLGRALLQAGELDRARVAIEHALRLAPERTFVRLTHAALLRAAGDAAGERAALEALVEEQPRTVDAVLRLAALAVLEGERDRSEELLERAYRAGARDPDLLSRLGHHALARDDRERAARRFDEALALRPDDDGAHLGAGRLALRRGRTAEALGHFERCASGPAAFECLLEQARTRVAQGELAQAEAALRAAGALAGADPARRGLVGRRLEALGKMQGSGGIQE